MYAIVNIAGQQYKVEKDQTLFVHRLEDKEGQTVQFDEVLLIDNDKDVLIGEPTIKGAMITGKVLSHPKADKVQVFKKKKRKGYRVLRGHRQFMTEIQIQDILEKGATVKSKPGAEARLETKVADSDGSGIKASGTKTAKAPAKKEASGTKTAKAPAKKEASGAKTAKAPVKKEASGAKTAKAPVKKKTAVAKKAGKPVPGKSDAKGQAKPAAGKQKKQ